MTSPCIHTAAAPYRNVTDPAACKQLTKADVMQDLENLRLAHVDLLLLHGPAQAYGTQGACRPEICDITRAQWAAYVELQKEGKARAIGRRQLNGSALSPSCHRIHYFLAEISVPLTACLWCVIVRRLELLPVLLCLPQLGDSRATVASRQPGAVPRRYGQRPGGFAQLLRCARHRGPGVLTASLRQTRGSSSVFCG